MSSDQEKRVWSDSEYKRIGQLDNWNNLLDMANAVRYGFVKYRLAEPGVSLDLDKVRSYARKVDSRWGIEHESRGEDYQKPSPEFSLCSLEAQCYLYSILDR